MSGARRGFTLIELLIVVAIISILASIAVPNYLLSQVRAKVSRVRVDHRTLATALEAYHTDFNSYPETNIRDRWRRFHNLTTPVAFLVSVPTDPFLPPADWDEQNFIDWGPRHGYYKMGCTPLTRPSRWALSSNGPDQDEDSVPIRFYPGYSDAVFIEQSDPDFRYEFYDATNGVISNGDVWRLSDHRLD